MENNLTKLWPVQPLSYSLSELDKNHHGFRSDIDNWYMTGENPVS